MLLENTLDKYANNQILRDLIVKHSFRHKDIAKLLTSKYGPVSIKTVSCWIYDERNMPGPMLELLTIKLYASTQQQPSQG